MTRTVEGDFVATVRIRMAPPRPPQPGGPRMLFQAGLYLAESDTTFAFNARAVEGHFAIKVLRGEEYFVVIENLPSDTIAALDAHALVRRVALLADGLEERLSRGGDIY